MSSADEQHQLRRRAVPEAAPGFERTHVVPQLGTDESTEKFLTPFEPNRPIGKARNFWERYRQITTNWLMDPELPTTGAPVYGIRRGANFFQQICEPLLPMKPITYSDPYLRPNPCPEEHWLQPVRWPNFKRCNPKIPPPIDGKYNDFYHYNAFKHWFMQERLIYVHHVLHLKEMLDRCILKEGCMNSPKNCRHLWHKYFAMTRMEEYNQTLYYMAITGNCAIRETPYPKDFVEQKRKIYDDWLYRTRLKHPGDIV